MSKQEQQEKRNQRIGMLTSLGIHAALLALFLFAMAWRAPDPPLPEFGIIVNIGFDDEGSGDVQTDEPATEPVVQEDEPTEEPVEPETEPVVEDKPVDKVEQTEVITSKIESPVVVKKQEEKVKEEPKKEEPKKEPEKVKTEYKPDANAPKNDNKGDKKTESEGDDKNKTGNKGEPEGTLDPNGQYSGKPGGGGGGTGFGLAMGGWAWAEQPKLPAIPDNENGRIEFEIECDEDGEIIGIKTLQRGLSPKAEQLLKEEIMRNSLVKTSSGAAPARSTGKVIFILKTR